MEKHNYSFHKHFVFRSPLLPYNISKKNHSLFLKNKKAKEALYLASPLLYFEFEKYNNDENYSSKKNKRIESSLQNYATRIRTRCSPFGLFAGCSVGDWGNENRIEISESFRKTRLDVSFQFKLAEIISQNKLLKPYIKWYPNSSIYTIGNSIRYFEVVRSDSRISHKLINVESNYHLSIIIEKSKKGITIEELSNLLINENVDRNNAYNYIEQLIESQILFNEIEPTITENLILEQLIIKIDTWNKKIKSKEITKLQNLLKTISNKLITIDKKIGNNINLYKNIISDLNKLNIKCNQEEVVFHVDLYKDNKVAFLDIELQSELAKSISFLNKINRPIINSNLKKFIEDFKFRYEDLEIPLLQVLDIESGVGYVKNYNTAGNILLQNINIQSSKKNIPIIQLDAIQKILLDKLILAKENNSKIIKLFDEDFKNIDYTTSSLPASMSVVFNLLNKNSNKIYLHSCSGVSAVNLIARFNDEKIQTIAKSIIEHERKQNPEVIFVEIIHIPDDKAGNIILRPELWQYELPYLTRSSVKNEFQIAIKDLYVKIVNDKIKLICKINNREIIPRLSCAHDFSLNSLPVYQFLSDLQSQYHKKNELNFSWGSLCLLFKFTPRVEYNNTVLEPATWHLQKIDFEEILRATNTSLFECIKRWQKKWNLPSLIYLVNGEKELLIDLKENGSVKSFLSLLKTQDSIVLTEYLFDQKNSVITKNNGKFANECIAFMLNDSDRLPIQTIEEGDKQIAYVDHKFIIGDEWFFLKIYCGEKTADKILTEIISRVVDNLFSRKLIGEWFFIRYNDPDFHLRIRLKIVNISLIGEVISFINSVFKSHIESKLIHKLAIDTYQRELERYGYKNIELTETLFYIDSFTTLKMISNSKDENNRWLYAFKSIDVLLNSFSFNISKKHDLIADIRSSYFAEHFGDKSLKIQLDNKYRNYKNLIQQFMNAGSPNNDSFITELKIIDEKRQLMTPIINSINKLILDGILMISIEELIASYIHMMLNRIFISRQRESELVIYDFLTKFYLSEMKKL